MNPQQMLQGMLTNQTVSETLDRLHKSVTPITGLELFRQDLSPVLTLMAPQDAPLRNRIDRIPGNGGAHEWNRLLKTTGPDGAPYIGGTTPPNAAFAKGGLPTPANPTYEHVSAPYKLIGDIAQVTDFDQAAGRSYIDIMAHLVMVKMKSLSQIEEWMTINGRVADNANYYDGLVVQCTENGEDLSGAQLKLSNISTPCRKVFIAGGMIQVAVMSPLMKQKIQDIILTQFFGIRQTSGLAGFDRMAGGLSVERWNFGFGEVELMMTRYLLPGSGSSGGSLERILLLDDTSVDENGNVVEMVDLLPMNMQPLARIATADRNLIQEYCLLKVSAPAFQAQVTNIAVPTFAS